MMRSQKAANHGECQRRQVRQRDPDSGRRAARGRYALTERRFRDSDRHWSALLVPARRGRPGPRRQLIRPSR